MKIQSLLVGLLLVCGCSHAQPEVVAVGKGSYASFPPPEVDKQARATLERQLYLTADAVDKPVPTNQWWTNLLVDRYAGQIWAFPHQVSANDKGINIAFPTRWNESGSDPISENPLRIGGEGFAPVDARAKSWSDWLVSFRLGENDGKYFDITLGRGLPYVWIEPKGVTPTLQMGGETKFFSPAGAELTLPVRTASLGVESGGRSYGLFAPTGSTFSRQGDTVSVQFPAAKQFLVVCPLPSKTDLATFQQFAYAIPRSSQLTWTYSPEKAAVETKWHLETEALQGTEKRLIQGWLPHHYRNTQNDLKFGALSYLTPRGTMKCAIGTDFTITYPFKGFPPMYPSPQNREVGLAHDYEPERMHDYLAKYATRDKYGDDTYWGGKSLTQAAQYMFIAHQLRDSAEPKLLANLKAALTDWYTYTPGEKAHFFARYPKWKALIGFNTSYGSEAFNDQHFHLGYFTSSTAMLGFLDPQWLKEYAPMARQIAKQYANWEREDANYPFLRCFDVWEGHSWAGGLSSPTGNNQESSSEAMQSWSGLFLLGTALNDPKMQAAGAMGYAMEARATQEYWFNQNGGNWSPNWKHDVVGMVWSGGNNYGTYFSGDPAWIWSIQWLPMSPALSYLAEDPVFAKKSFGQMWAARKASKDGEIDLDKVGTGLGNVILGQAAQVNPEWTVEQLDALWDKNSGVAHDNDTPGLTYFFAHSNRAWGQIAPDYRVSSPLGRVYYDVRTKTTSYCAFNPTDAPQKVLVWKADKAVGSFTAAPRQLTIVSKLTP
ncbi:hypothetical protein EON83_09105 [bacterium]|nr:MAG: hypothetical protein EON83_09105 [bacterium]